MQLLAQDMHITSVMAAVHVAVLLHASEHGCMQAGLGEMATAIGLSAADFGMNLTATSWQVSFFLSPCCQPCLHGLTDLCTLHQQADSEHCSGRGAHQPPQTAHRGRL